MLTFFKIQKNSLIVIH